MVYVKITHNKDYKNTCKSEILDIFDKEVYYYSTCICTGLSKFNKSFWTFKSDAETTKENTYLSLD